MIVLSNSQYYSDIANAIRAKNGENTQYKPSEMALAIKSLQGGGINCTLTISTVPNATVTATFENQTVTAVADVNGTAILELSKEGVWTVTASLNGETVSKEIDTSLALETEIQFADPILENNSWEDISKVAKSGKASQYWNVGDTKKFTFNNAVYEAQIIGFDHDNVTDPTSYGRAKAGITFQFKTICSAANWFNQNPWHGSALRTTTMADILTNMDDCKNYIVPVNKISMTAYNHASETIVSDSLFLLSEGEIFGEIKYCGIPEGSQYAFYAAGNSTIKTKNDGSVIPWWTRSLVYNNTKRRVLVGRYEAVTYADWDFSNGIAPAFCI